MIFPSHSFTSLSDFRVICHSLNNIQDSIPNIIHVAGTNGKGSTIAFLRNILSVYGASINVFTSPHIVEYNERIRIHGQLISDTYLQQVNTILSDLVSDYNSLSFFAKAMLQAFWAFSDHIADFTILETGLGGRLDATNVISKPILNMITHIGFDHQHFLGNTLASIAQEKGGIIKTTTITDYQDQEVFSKLNEIAQYKNVPLITGGQAYFIKDNILNYKKRKIPLDNLGLKGLHQAYNAALAVVASLYLFPDLSDETILKGLEITNWPARLQKVDYLYGNYFTTDDFFIDGAHNQSGAEVLAQFIRQQNDIFHYDNIYFIFAMLQTKDLSAYIECFASLPITWMPLDDDFAAFYKVENLVQVLQKKGAHIHHKLPTCNQNYRSSIIHYLKEIQVAQGKNLILCAGSLYLLGEIMRDNSMYLV